MKKPKITMSLEKEFYAYQYVDIHPDIFDKEFKRALKEQLYSEARRLNVNPDDRRLKVVFGASYDSSKMAVRLNAHFEYDMKSHEEALDE